MPTDVIRVPGVSSGAIPLSPAIRAGGFVFVSGQASVDELGKIVEDTFAGEMRRSFANVEAVLQAAGLSLRNVVQVRSYVAKQEDLPEYNRLYAEIFSPPYPARTTLIGCLGTVVKFEVDVIAFHEPCD
ncbi:MAG: RidA family protein [Pirellulales bacterium]|nr:RidA family protein [Pirellulales bacterium]